jgi:hypothetical protein
MILAGKKKNHYKILLEAYFYTYLLIISILISSSVNLKLALVCSFLGEKQACIDNFTKGTKVDISKAKVEAKTKDKS